ncbi:unnamed protein product [Adineta steineri]|uniref:Uncharacterized protein n=1 Tax=Adineta steineri TaxID=433720 RepID=A0A815QN91_9BILA|nr:unnamed protein product [Adineta steineri]
MTESSITTSNDNIPSIMIISRQIDVYLVIRADKSMLALKSNNLTMKEAAAIPSACETSYEVLSQRCSSSVRQGIKLFICGGNSAIGLFTIQLTKVVEASIAIKLKSIIDRLERTGSSPHVLQQGGFPQQLRHIVGGPGLLIGTGKALLDLIDFVFISVVACLFVPSQLGKPQQLQHGGLPQHIKQALGGLDGLEYT